MFRSAPFSDGPAHGDECSVATVLVFLIMLRIITELLRKIILRMIPPFLIMLSLKLCFLSEV